MRSHLHQKPSQKIWFICLFLFFLSHTSVVVHWTPSQPLPWTHKLLEQNVRGVTLSSSRAKSHDPSKHVAIVVTVHGALDYLTLCLDSWAAHTFHSHIFLVDDCIQEAQSYRLEKLAALYENITFIPKMGNGGVGYTRAVNKGFQAAQNAGFDYIAQLNSDTILTPNWLPPLISVLKSTPRAGAVGPLSNAASWQSVPKVVDESGTWSRNALPPNVTAEMMARLVFLLSNNKPADLPILNGFLILYPAEVFRKVGLMDEVISPHGYGEENDFAFRLRRHNYTLWVASNSYVYHHKGKSYQKEESITLGKEARRRLEDRYGLQVRQAESSLRDNNLLEATRSSMQCSLLPSIPSLQHDMSVLIILNVMDSSKKFMLRGGWISVVQEGLGLWKNGAYSKIAVPAGYLDDFYAAFPKARVANLFIGFTGNDSKAVAAEIIARGQVFDFVVATHCSTVETIRMIIKEWPNVIPSYFIQDIETKFTDEQARASALRSYTTFNDGFVFSKTLWLQKELLKAFNLTSYLISPTVDTEFFTPGRQDFKHKLQLCAMVRMTTPRRSPKKTLELLSWAAEALGANSRAFGSSIDEIELRLNEDEKKALKLPLIEILGPLDRQRMLQVYQTCEIFLDLSSWQAFGRSGIEAMASGVIPILPQQGGASTYARANVNAFLINTSSTVDAKKLLKDITAGKYNLNRMRNSALAAASEFSIQDVTRKTYRTFRDFLHEWRQIKASLPIQGYFQPLEI